MNDEKSKRCLAVIGLMLAGFLFLATMRGCGAHYSDGQRSGELRKISRKGLMIKSWEGQLLLSTGYVRKSDGSGGPDVWEFSITDENVAKQLESLPTNSKVILTYRQWFIGPISQDTKYTVIGVK